MNEAKKSISTRLTLSDIIRSQDGSAPKELSSQQTVCWLLQYHVSYHPSGNED